MMLTKRPFDEYTPDVTAQIIRLDNEDKAKEVLEKAKAVMQILLNWQR